MGAEWLQITKLFHTVLWAKPCDNRVTEKPSTFSRARPYVVAPRPGLEPGTYGLTVRADFHGPDDFALKTLNQYPMYI